MDRQRQKITDRADPADAAETADAVGAAKDAVTAEKAASSPSARSSGKRRHVRRVAIAGVLLGLAGVLLVAGVAAWIDANEARTSRDDTGADAGGGATTNAGSLGSSSSTTSASSNTIRFHDQGAAVLPLPPDSADSPWGIYLYNHADADWDERLAPVQSPIAPDLPEHLVVLVHGLDEPGGIWNDAASAIASAGLRVARFDYPNDQAIALSAELLAAWLAELHVRGVRRVDLVGHSMGGLVSRDTLTRDQPGFYQGHGRQSFVHTHPGLPDVGRLITVATPHAGAELARYRAVAELREHASRLAEHSWTDLTTLITGSTQSNTSIQTPAQAMQSDGDGQAGRDLLPNSAFLVDLNARPWPKDVTVTAIVGLVSSDIADAAAWITQTLGTQGPWLTAAGDGIVSQASATPGPPVTDVVNVSGTHRGLLARWALERSEREPPAVGVIVDRLTSDTPP